MSEERDNHPQPFRGLNESENSSQSRVRAAFYVFNEKIEIFADTINYLAKFSDLMLMEFGDGRLYFEAITASKSAYACATFEESSISEWGYGDLENIVDKRVQLSTKQLVGSLRNVNKNDTLHLFITGLSCDTVTIQYVNARDIMRTYDLQAREMSLFYNRANHTPDQYANKIVCTVVFFKTLFSQLNDNDEICCQFYPDHSVITKYVSASQEATASTLHSMQPGDTYERYEITVPMSMIVSVRELKVSLKLIGVHNFMAHIHFDIGGKKPLLITFEDDQKDEHCKVLLSVADVREINDDEEEERQSESAATQSVNNSHRESEHSRVVYMPAYDISVQEEAQEPSNEPPPKQRRISKPFSFEHDSDENSGSQQHGQNISHNSNSGNHHYVPPNGTPSDNQDVPINNFPNDNNDSFNNGDFQHPDFDDIPAAAAPLPSDPPPQGERNSTSPTCLALRMLGIEDQISDIEAPDAIETYDIEVTDPNEDLYILSQIPNGR